MQETLAEFEAKNMKYKNKIIWFEDLVFQIVVISRCESCVDNEGKIATDGGNEKRFRQFQSVVFGKGRKKKC